MKKEIKIIFFIFISAALLISGWYAIAATNVQTSVNILTIKDSDGDGILDDEDPHPNMPEIYIVEDENRNGIVDEFENIPYEDQNEDGIADNNEAIIHQDGENDISQKEDNYSADEYDHE